MKRKNFVLYMDDTGINPKEKTSVILQNEKATHAGVIIREELIEPLNTIMTQLCNNLLARFSTDEFHFADIYNRNKNFKSIQIEETIDILETFTELFQTYSLRIVASTVNGMYLDHINKNKEYLDKALKATGLPVCDKAYSMLFTYTKAKQHVEELTRRAHISKIVCDEGLKKKCTKLEIPGADTTIEFKDSADDKLLQLADFAAWFMSRSKNIFDKIQKTQKVSELDSIILDIYSRLSPQYVGKQTKLRVSSNMNYDQIFQDIIEKEN